MHHTVPRSRGGENSRQIPLCATCHNALHFNALEIKSKITNPKRVKKNKKFWESIEQEQRAAPFLQVLVESLVKPIPKNLEREHLLSLSVTSSVFEQFKLLQLDLGLSSQEKTLEHCILSMIETRGLHHVKKNVNADLWFMLRSH